MKRSIKILIIALAATMVVSFGIAALILAVTGNIDVASETINESKTFEPSEISSIEVDLVSDDLNIIPTTKGDITVHLYGQASTNVKRSLPRLVAYKTGDKLHIEVEQRPNIFFAINIRRTTTLDIYIPQIQLEEMDIDIVSGDVRIEDLESSRLVIDSTSGDMMLEEIRSEKIRIGSTSGDVSVRDYTGSIDVTNTSGSVSLISGSGNKDIFIKSVSGDILIDQDAVSDMSIEVTSGDVRVTLPREAEFYLDASNISGEIKQDFAMKTVSSSRRKLEGSVGDSEYRIAINATSGDITVGY
jgi:lia operon protein LiaG